MNDKGYVIRDMRRDEIDTAIEWAAEEGWNPGLDDAEVFWQTDPKGFIALERNRELIGSGSITAYNSDFGFMGLFIVKPEYRSKGLGAKLWYHRRDKLLGRLKKGATIGLDGVFELQSFYTKGGFKFSHRNLRMEGIASRADYSKDVRKVTPDDFERIIGFDKEFFGFERKTFLDGWLKAKHASSFMYVEDSEIKGYGVVRKCRTGFKIGPLFVADFERADELFRALSSVAAGESIYLDVPEVNESARRLAEEYKMKESFGTARMYYGESPNLPYNQIYGLTTFELG